ncbi:hypothetical protein [Oerskovia enterophila]|uniref:hypothetical protein n=1 Tax=Oerskovia enterophila TaxID=43678 RepID=UPI0033954647
MTTTEHAPHAAPPRRSWRRGKKDPSPALRPVEPTAAPHSRAEEHQPTPAPRREKKDRELWGKVAQARDMVADVILPESDDENDEVASYPRWPVMILSGSAFVAIWGGWVALGLMCGFGPVNLLPGIGSGLTVNLAITLPLGMEVYAAYALGAWLTRRRINSKARTFAKWSSLFSLTLGWGGQVVYHLLASRGIEQAPWQVVVAVSGIPVLVLAFGAGLAHLLTVPHKRTRRPGVMAAAPLEDVPAPVTTPVAATVPVVAEAPAPVVATVAPADPAPWGGAPDPAPLPAPAVAAARVRAVDTGRVPVVYPEGISERDRQILALAIERCSQRAIVEQMNVGKGTVGRVWDEHRTFLAEHGVQLRAKREDVEPVLSAHRLHGARVPLTA